MNYTRSTLLMIMLMLAHAAICQSVIKGKLRDEKGLPIPYATVGLVKTQTNALTVSALSDSLGQFSITTEATGKFYLRFSAIGFAIKSTDSFDVSGSRDFGVITLKADVKDLKNVTVTALRPTIIQKEDRMVVSIEGTAMASGNTAYSVLAKSPGVFIDPDGNIQLNGRSGVTVMINGKQTYLSARDLRTLLESMPAEDLKNIEIITNPSAQYDAEGTSGILNINFKKNIQDGVNGGAYAGYSTNLLQSGYSWGTNVNFKKGKWNSFASWDLRRGFGGREATFTRIFYSPGSTTYFDQAATGDYTALTPATVRAGTDYNFNLNQSVGVAVNFLKSTSDNDFLTQTNLSNAPGKPFQYIQADNYNHNVYTNTRVNLHYAGKFDSAGTTLTSDLDYARVNNKGYANFYNYFTQITQGTQGQETRDFDYTLTPNKYNVYSAKIDFSKPFKNSRFDAGLKASHVVSDNDFQFYINNNGLVLDATRTNHFYYSENIFAAYINLKGKLSKKLSYQAGLRGEETQSHGQSYTTGQITDRNYFNLFPSVFLQQSVSDNYSINYSYSRRISRPNYGNLNPFRAYRDPYTWVQGNPYLLPQYTNSFQVTQTFHKTYNVIINYQVMKNVMAEIPILDVTNNTTIYTTGNVDNGYSGFIEAIVPLKVTPKWWDTQNTIALEHNKLTTITNTGPVVNEQTTFSIQSGHTIQLPKGFRMEMTFYYQSAAAQGLYHMAAMSRLDVAFKKSILKKKFDLSINVNDIYKGYRFLWTTNIGGNVNDFNQYLRFRTFNFTIRYNFSKGQKVNIKQRSSVEEMNRI